MKVQNPFSLAAVWIVFLVTAYLIFVFRPIWHLPINQGLINWDALGYYAYLPAIFIHHDVGLTELPQYVAREYQLTEGFYGTQIGNAKVLQYSCGQALLEAPWFAIGHLYAKAFGYKADGFSMPYQMAIQIGMWLFCMLGVAQIRRVLLRFFDDVSVAITLFLLLLGSNYLPYASVLVSYTHAPLFTVYAVLLTATIRFYSKINFTNSVLLGLCVGVAMLTRPTEVVCILIPLLWGVYSIETLRERATLLRQNLPNILLAVATAAAIGSLQIFYWHTVSGKWIMYSYGDQTFSFLAPHLYNCLISSRKGWLVYSPIVIFGLIGWVLVWRKPIYFATIKPFRFALTLTLLLALYITFSWDNWWYGGGIGQRATIQYLPFLAFFFAAFVEYIRQQKISKYVFTSFAALFLWHNAWVIYGAFYGGYINTEETNDAYFFSIFWRWYPPNETTVMYLDNPEQRTEPMSNPTVIYTNNFENDTSANADSIGLNGTRGSIVLDSLRTLSASYTVSERRLSQARIRANIRCRTSNTIVWSTARYTQFTIRFMQNDVVVREQWLRLQRFMKQGAERDIFIDVKNCSRPYNKIIVVFMQEYESNLITKLDDLRVVAY